MDSSSIPDSYFVGGSTFGPENNMWTMKKSVEVAKVPVLEIDIQTTKDGVLVLRHDNKNWFGTISDMTYKELCQVDAAYDWTPDGKEYPLRDKGHQIPTLLQVFEEWAESFPSLVFYLDIKGT